MQALKRGDPVVTHLDAYTSSRRVTKKGATNILGRSVKASPKASMRETVQISRGRCTKTWCLDEPVASVVPADDDPPPETGQRQGLRSRLDRVACRAREMAPGLDGHRRLRASPRPDDLALEQDATRPDTRGPERATTVGVRDQEFAIVSLEEEVRRRRSGGAVRRPSAPGQRGTSPRPG
jgi:hypothetical protein